MKRWLCSERKRKMAMDLPNEMFSYRKQRKRKKKRETVGSKNLLADRAFVFPLSNFLTIQRGKRRMIIAIHGAGVSGLAAARWAIEYGHWPVIFERSDCIGGAWNYARPDVSSTFTVFQTSVNNTSKDMTSFSDYPIADNLPVFMHHKTFMDYINSYALNYNLFNYIQFNTTVNNVSRSECYESTGKIDVTFTNACGTSETQTFDAFLLCTGRLSEPSYPNEYPGQISFPGKIIHSAHYRRGSELKGPSCAVGLGNSSIDIAADLNSRGEKVVLSSRSGAWVYPKIGPGGLPFDLFVNRQGWAVLKSLLPFGWYHRLTEKFLNYFFLIISFMACKETREELKYQIQEPPISQSSASAPYVEWTSTTKGEISSIDGHCIKFPDGSTFLAHNLIFCTGFRHSFPTLQKDGLEQQVKEKFCHIWPIKLPHTTFGAIGYVTPLHGFLPIVELQCRSFFSVLSNESKLPTRSIMESDIRQQEMQKGRVEYLPYMMQLSTLMNAQPTLFRLIFHGHFRLAYIFMFKHVTPYFFRLFGPKKWHGAEKAILNVEGRVKKGICGDIYNNKPANNFMV